MRWERRAEGDREEGTEGTKIPGSATRLGFRRLYPDVSVASYATVCKFRLYCAGR